MISNTYIHANYKISLFTSCLFMPLYSVGSKRLEKPSYKM